MAGEAPSLLIVHQNLNMAKTLATLLAKEYNVFIAKGASQVPELIPANRIQLVLASYQLPDSTGLELFSQLFRTHPAVIRILLISEEDRDKVDLEEALSSETIHRYLREPLRSSHFLETVRRGIQLYSGATEPPVADQSEAVSEPEPVLSVLEAGPEQPEDLPGIEQDQPAVEAITEAPVPPLEVESPPASAGVDAEADGRELEAARQSYEAMVVHQRELQEALEKLDESRQRIEQLEAVQRQVTEEKEQLFERLMQLQRENAALSVLRQENASLREEAEGLKKEIFRLNAENGELRLETEALREANAWQEQALKAETEAVRGELDKLKQQLDSLGVLKSLGQIRAISSAELEKTVDDIDIYPRAAEWCTQLSQARNLNRMLEVQAEQCKEEIARLHEAMSASSSRHETERARLLRQAREQEEQIRAFKGRAEAQEAALLRLQAEREELARKLLWMQAQWKTEQSRG